MDENNLLQEKEENLLRMMVSTVGVSSKTHQYKAALDVLMIRKLIDAMDKNSKSADRLSSGLNWLTGIIAFAATLQLIIAVLHPLK